MNPSTDLVNKLWRLCSILRKDGVTYQQYVTELTYLLFLKMMQEKGLEEGRVPAGLRWGDLLRAEGLSKLKVYRNILARLGDPEYRADRSVQAIFANASTIVREPTNLSTLVSAIDELHWFSAERDSFGDLYEGLLQRNAEETKRGAGQYFTPRVLIRMLVALMKPKAGEVIQDPPAAPAASSSPPTTTWPPPPTTTSTCPRRPSAPSWSTTCRAWRTCRTSIACS